MPHAPAPRLNIGGEMTLALIKLIVMVVEVVGIINKLHQSGHLVLIPMVYMIRWGTFGNGMPILGMEIMRGHRLMGVSGREVMRVAECCVVVRGTTTRPTSVPPSASGATPPTVTTTMVSVWLRGLFNLLSFFPFFLFFSS